MLRNSFGGRIRLSFFPALSVLLSFAMIMFNAILGPVRSSSSSGLSSAFSWSAFACSTVLFRVHAWVLLCAFLGEFALATAALVVGANLIVLLHLSPDLTGIEPVTCSVYSLTVPTAEFASTASSEEEEKGAKKKKSSSSSKVLRAMAWSGAAILSLSVWALVLYLRFLGLDHSPSVRIRRDALLPQAAAATVAASASALAAALLPGHAEDVGGRRESKTNKSSWLRKHLSLPASIALLLLPLGGYAALLLHGNGSERFFVAGVSVACGQELEGEHRLELEGYSITVTTNRDHTLDNRKDLSFSLEGGGKGKTIKKGSCSYTFVYGKAS